MSLPLMKEKSIGMPTPLHFRALALVWGGSCEQAKVAEGCRLPNYYFSTTSPQSAQVSEPGFTVTYLYPHPLLS